MNINVHAMITDGHCYIIITVNNDPMIINISDHNDHYLHYDH